MKINAKEFVQSLLKENEKYVTDLINGNFVKGYENKKFDLTGIRLFIESHYHLVNIDIGNLAIYLAKARDYLEIEFFLLMVNAEKLMLDTLIILGKRVGITLEDLESSKPVPIIISRSNYFSRLALYSTPGEIALAILLNFPLWAGGARKLSKALKKHYGLNNKDTDFLDRFSKATEGFNNMAITIIQKELTDETQLVKMKEIGRLAVEYETIVWKEYYNETMRRIKKNKN